MGFTPTGIREGSLAAILQSAGASGIGIKGNIILAGIGALTGVCLHKKFTGWQDERKNKGRDNPEKDSKVKSLKKIDSKG